MWRLRRARAARFRSSPSIRGWSLTVRRAGSATRSSRLWNRALLRLYSVSESDRLPVFDTTLSDLNITQLFQESVFSGYDRISQANQLTAALTTRYLDSASGIEWFRGTIGQRFYFDDQKVGIYDYYTNQLMGIRTDSKSDLLGSVGVRLTRTLTADGTVQYSSSEGRVSRAYAGFRWQPKRASAVSLYYRYNYAPNDTYNNIKQLDLAAQWPITDKLYVVGRYNYSFNKKGIIEALGGFEYHADCWTLRAVVQRYIISTNKYDNTSSCSLN